MKVKFLALALVMVLVLPVAVLAQGTVNVLQTGQTTSYHAGDDGALQVGIGMSGRFSATTNTVNDNLTGLEWVKQGDLGAMTWKAALEYVTSVNSGAGIDGKHDWRLANIKELESLSNFEAADQSAWLNSQGFTNVAADKYWASNSYLIDADDPTGAWFVRMNGKQRNYDVKDTVNTPQGPYTAAFNIMLVRGDSAVIPKSGDDACSQGSGGSWTNADPCNHNILPGQDGQLQKGVAWPTTGTSPDGRFTDHGNGTITDHLYGLMWDTDLHTDVADQVNWTGALDAANASTVAGFDDWHLSNWNELEGLMNFDSLSLADTDPGFEGFWQYLLDAGFVGDTFYSEFWTSTTNAAATTTAYLFNTDGRVPSRDKAAVARPWMAVRELTVVPEPMSYLLFVMGGLLVVGRGYLKKRAVKA